MELLDQILRGDPELAGQMRDLSRVLTLRQDRPVVRGGENLVYVTGVEPFDLDAVTAEQVASDLTPAAGIYGLGITVADGGRPTPAVLVVESLVDGADLLTPIPVWDLPSARAVVSPYLRMAGFRREGPAANLTVIGIPPPSEALGINVGGACKCSGVTGELGLEVRYQGRPGILTAGHVGWPVGARVTVDGQIIGEVAVSDRLSHHAPGELVADVAVIQTAPDVVISAVTHPMSFGPGGRNAKVVSGSSEGEIHTLMPDFSLRQGQGAWGDVYFITPGISRPGNSGAAVYTVPKDVTTIGHVVGGCPPQYTLVQDMKYLLDATGATLW